MTLPLKLIRPLVFFDLETTGLDFKYDRIIEIGALKVFPDGTKATLCKRINPGIRIPVEVSALTGITNEAIAKEPTFSELIPEIAAFFERSDLAGYNVARFDAKMMAEEFKRAGHDFELEKRQIIDMQIIFHQKEKRDLAAALKFYCNKELTSAHSAQSDTEATFEIFLSQLNQYADLPRDVSSLSHFCRRDQDRFVDSEGKFFWRDGEAAFNFGRYKSQTLRSVAKEHPEYLEWVLSPQQRFSQEVIEICYRATKGEFPTKA